MSSWRVVINHAVTVHAGNQGLEAFTAYERQIELGQRDVVLLRDGVEAMASNRRES